MNERINKNLKQSPIFYIMVDYWSVSMSIIIIVGVFMYQYYPEGESEKIYIPDTIVRRYILAFLSPRERSYINKETNRDAALELKRSVLLEHFPPEILLAIGGIDKCVNKYGYIKGTREMMGETRMLDGVRVEDLPNTECPVFIGIDYFGRPFALLRYWCCYVESEDDSFPPKVTSYGDYLHSRYNCRRFGGGRDDMQYREKLLRLEYEQSTATTEIHQPNELPKQVVVAMFPRYTDKSPYVHAVLASNATTTWCFGSSYSSRYIPGDTRITYAALKTVSKIARDKPVLLKGWRSKSILLSLNKPVDTSI